MTSRTTTAPGQGLGLASGQGLASGASLEQPFPLSPSLQSRIVRMCETSEVFLALVSAQVGDPPSSAY